MAVVAAFAVAGFAAPALGGGGKQKPDERVYVKDNFFTPRSVTVEAGDVVRWIWRSNYRHNVTFKRVPRGGGKRGATTRRDGRWQRKFREPGTYRYVCTLYAGMRGSVTVERPPEPSRNTSDAEGLPTSSPLPASPAAGAQQ
jgi:plastocyanin